MRGKTGLELSCICTASSRSTKEVSYFYLGRDERDGRFGVGRGRDGPPPRDLSREQRRQLRGMSLMTLHLGSRQLYMGPKHRQDLFTTAAAADWNRAAACVSICSRAGALVKWTWRSWALARWHAGQQGGSRAAGRQQGSRAAGPAWQEHEKNAKISRPCKVAAFHLFRFMHHAPCMSGMQRRGSLRWGGCAVCSLDWRAR
jgi:hypothetical protein